MKERHLFLLGLGALVGVVLVGLFLGGTTDGPDEGTDAVRSRPLIATVRPHLASAKSAPVDRPRPQAADDAEPPESEQEPVFEVGGRAFRSLAEAVEAAEPGETITLNGDAYVRKPVVVRKSLRFNLNGYRLTAKNTSVPRIRRQRGDFGRGGHAISVEAGNKVVVENGFIDVVSNGGKNGFTGAVEQVQDLSQPASAEPDPVAEAQPSEPAQVDEHPEDAQYDVVVRDVEVMSDARWSSAFLNSDGTMLIDGCTVQSDGGVGNYTIGADSRTTIRDCDFETVGEAGEGQWWNSALAVAFDGTTTVESGSYVSRMAEGAEGTAYGTYVFSSGGVIDVKGGDFVADNVVQTDKDMTNYGETFGVSEVVIRDGAFSGKMDKTVVGENAGEMAGTSAYGGVYDNKPTPEQVPEGKVVVDNGDGIYSVADATAGN